MLPSHSIIRRFTPPTCTLEIWAKNSPLSRWTNRQLVKDIHFQLSFDDPRMPAEKQVTIKGDRVQLEQLYETVTNYVQNFLQHSSPKKDLLTLAVINESTQQISPVTKPSLQPLGLVAHELILGSLDKTNSVNKIKLSALQLFDLATALDQYYEEIAALPELYLPRKKRIVPLWGSSVAILLVAIGVTGVAIQMFSKYESTNNNVATSPATKSAPLSNPDLVDVIPPKIPKTEQKLDNQAKLKEPLSSLEKLPPPPPVDLPKPPPAGVPDPAKYPFLEPAKIPQPPPARTESTIAIKPESVKTESSAAPSTESVSKAPSEVGKVDKTEKNSRLSHLSAPQASISGSTAENSLSSRGQSSSSTFEEKEQSTDREIATRENSFTVQYQQLKEAEKYFQQRWQPPKDLKQTLEYQLAINSDGSIKQITPLGKASEIYLDRTNIPLMGESFVSPVQDQANLKIRLLLSPDGEVRTFLEKK